MELITLTYEIKNRLGINNSIITKNKDYLIKILRINTNYISLSCPFIDITYGETLQLSFNSKRGIVNLLLEVENIDENEKLMIIEAAIISIDNTNFINDLELFIKELLIEKKRKEERILCTHQNLQILNLINKINFEFKNKLYNAIIKDISFSGIHLLCSPTLLEQINKGDLFSFKLKFFKPDVIFSFEKCILIRKEKFNFNNTDFTSVILEIKGNSLFNSRISSFFEQTNEKKRKRY